MDKKMLNEFRRLSGLKLINENISKDKYEIFKSFKEHLKTIDDLTSDFEAGVEGRARAILGSSKEIKSLEDLLQQLYVDNPSLKDFLDKEYLNENTLNEDTTSELLIEDISLMVRTKTICKKLGIITVEDFKSFPWFSKTIGVDRLNSLTNKRVFDMFEDMHRVLDEGHLNEDEALNEGGIKFDLYEPSVADNFKAELTSLLNRYLGISNTDDFGTSNDNKMFVHKNLMDMVSNTFPANNMRMSNENGVYYTNRPEEMSEFLKNNSVQYKNLKSVR